MQSTEYKVQTRLEQGFYDDTERFGGKNGFFIGAAITGNYEPLFTIPPEIGDLKFYSKYWS